LGITSTSGSKVFHTALFDAAARVRSSSVFWHFCFWQNLFVVSARQKEGEEGEKRVS
jgi:hypothetical protein